MMFLLVDDDERVNLLISKKLEAFGKCVMASNGEEALDLFTQQLESESPFDAVFMDIQMPGMDGHEVVGKMREIEKNKGVEELKTFKLIMVSAHSDTKNVCKSFFHGYADAFVAKSDIKERLIDELRNIKLLD